MLLDFMYRWLTWLGTPFIYLYLVKRRVKGKEDTKRFRERLGYPSVARPEGHVIWLHAASVGESLSAIPLIQKIRESFPHVHIIITTGTVTSAQLLETHLPKSVIHQFIPVDLPQAVARFLRHWKPDLALWLESEFWPNLILQTQDYCPLILVNARVTARAAKGWSRVHSLCQRVVGSFRVVLPQTQQDADRLKIMGAKDIRFVGNLKYDAPPLADKAQERELLQTSIQERKCWAAVSTHEGEEEHVIQAHKLLKITYPDIVTLLIPRHATRGETVRALVENEGISCAQRSRSESIAATTEIYLADTLGELGIFFRLSPITFVGGSFVEKGGHNPLEPARLKSVVLFGPSMYNFSEIAAELLGKQGALQVKDAVMLASTVHMLLEDKEQRRHLAQAAHAVVSSHAGAIDKIIALIKPYCCEVV